MLEPEISDDDLKGERSLLALGETLRDMPEKQPSKLALAIAEVRAEQSASDRHRAARLRRTAPANPLLEALATEKPVVAREPQPQPSEVPVEPDTPRAENPVVEPFESHETVQSAEEADAQVQAETKAAKIADAAQTAAARAQAFEREEDAREEGRREADAENDADTDTSGDTWKPLIDPGKVIAGVRRSRNLIIATTIAGAVLGVAVAVTTPKKYEAVTELLADPRDLNLVDKELTQSGLSNEATLAIVENQVRILQSGTVLSQVVDRLKLADDPEFNGTAPATGLSGIVQSIKSVVSRPSSSEDSARRNSLATENLARSLSIARGGKTFVIVIGATTRDGQKSALIANTMTDVFLKAYGQLQSDAAGRAADELTSKLDELRASVEGAERKVETFKAENDIIDPQGRLITDDEIVKLNEQVSVARARTLELNARAASMRAFNVDSVLGGVLPEELASATIQEMRAQYSALKSEADRLDVRLGPRHPQRQAIDAQLKGARVLIDAELNRIISSAQTELKRAVQLEQELSSRLAQLKVRQGDLSNEMVTLRELERDSTAKRAVYEAFLLRARETGEQRGINSANMSVISKAFPPLNPNPPSRSTISLTGMMLGFLAGLGLGIARGTYDSLSGTADSAAGGRAWRRRRRRALPGDVLPQPPLQRFPPPVPRTSHESVAAAGDGSATPTAAEGEAFSTTAEPQPQPAAEPAQPRDMSMRNPTYGDNPAMNAAQPYQAPYPQAATPAYPAPVHPGVYLQPWQQSVHPAQHMPPVYPQGYAAQPHPAQMQPAPYWQHPQMMPQPGYPYGQPGAVRAGMYAPQPAYPYQPAAMPVTEAEQPAAAAQPEQSQIEEIRASLRECRDAIRDLTEARSKRRYF